MTPEIVDDPEDIEMLEAYERGALRPLRNSKALIASAREAAVKFRKERESSKSFSGK